MHYLPPRFFHNFLFFTIFCHCFHEMPRPSSTARLMLAMRFRLSSSCGRMPFCFTYSFMVFWVIGTTLLLSDIQPQGMLSRFLWWTAFGIQMSWDACTQVCSGPGMQMEGRLPALRLVVLDSWCYLHPTVRAGFYSVRAFIVSAIWTEEAGGHFIPPHFKHFHITLSFIGWLFITVLLWIVFIGTKWGFLQ